MGELAPKFRVLFVWIAGLCMASTAAAQIPASFQIPIMGYLFDAGSRSIRPVAGILGNSTIEAPLPVAPAIEKALFLPDQRHAIVDSPDSTEALLVDLRESRTMPIRGAPSSITEMRASPDGTVAALYYAGSKKVTLVSGLPDGPVIRATIDVSFTNDALRRFAISNDGATALLDFESGEQNSLYSWTTSGGPHYLSGASRISDMTFLGDDAVIVDSGSDQAILIRNVRGQAATVLIADAGDGLSHPSAVFVSSRSEIYIGDSTGGILVLDSTGHILRRARCSCVITTMALLASSALRLTDRVDQPLFVLDGSEADRIFFIPALPAQAAQGNRQ